MADPSAQKRKLNPRADKKSLPKRVKRQQAYDSGSSSESEDNNAFIARDAPRDKPLKKSSAPTSKSKAKNGRTDTAPKSILSKGTKDAEGDSESEESSQPSEHSEDSAADSISSENEDAAGATRAKTKRRDPEVFAKSISAILSSNLPSSKQQDPVLARSKDAEEAAHEITEGRLEVKAKRKLRDEKRLAKERGRVKDVLLGEPVIDTMAGPNGKLTRLPPTSAAEVAEQEKRLRKTAQRGVVKLFNAVRAAQVRGEQASRAVREKGVVGQQQREEKVGEMGRQAFLDMVGAGGKAAP